MNRFNKGIWSCGYQRSRIDVFFIYIIQGRNEKEIFKSSHRNQTPVPVK